MYRAVISGGRWSVVLFPQLLYERGNILDYTQNMTGSFSYRSIFDNGITVSIQPPTSNNVAREGFALSAAQEVSETSSLTEETFGLFTVGVNKRKYDVPGALGPKSCRVEMLGTSSHTQRAEALLSS